MRLPWFKSRIVADCALILNNMANAPAAIPSVFFIGFMTSPFMLSANFECIKRAKKPNQCVIN
jgi:hypothetical protein